MKIFFIPLCLLGFLSLVSCESEPDGPEEAIEETGDAIEDAADEVDN